MVCFFLLIGNDFNGFGLRLCNINLRNENSARDAGDQNRNKNDRRKLHDAQ